MSRKDLLGIEPASVRLFIDVGAVLRSARPVHQLIRLIGTFVEEVNAEGLCHIPGDRHKLLRRHISGAREDKTDTRSVLRAAVRGVQHGGIDRILFVIFKEVLVDPVTVESYHRTEIDGIDLSASAFQRTGNKAAVILCGIALRLTHFCVLLSGLGSTDGDLEPLLQSIKGRGLVDPFFCLTVAAVGNSKLTHYLNLLTAGVSPNSNLACLARVYACSVLSLSM